MRQKLNMVSKACILSLLFIWCTTAISLGDQSSTPGDIERIGVTDARNRMKSGDALLVCSYDDETCRGRGVLLEGAILLSDLEKKLPSLSKEREIIFYCACQPIGYAWQLINSVLRSMVEYRVHKSGCL